jgi:predicted RNA-binding Zn-ribbon protein involved in translation (DUF1610 family)
MADSEPQGCLLAILRLFGMQLGETPVAEELPYRQRDDFLSPAELSFYRVLILALNQSFLVCPKVNLADIFFVAQSSRSQSYRNRIDRKHVDFLLCDPTSIRPVAGIELDDSSHGRSDRQIRDQFVDQVFRSAGLPLVRIPVTKNYSPQNIETLIREALNHQQSPSRGTVTHEEGIPHCPKCGSLMIVRTAKKGEQQGEEFWGCKNYPKCRGTVHK